MNEFKLIVAGGRDFNDYARLSQALEELANTTYALRAVSLVSGMARGADSLAVRFAKEHDVELYEFPADWETNGKAAGFVRNLAMTDFADGLLAFWDGQSRGTAHMIKAMQNRNKPVHIVHYAQPTASMPVLTRKVNYARRGGYECSSKGDARFSALNARMPDGRTIEAHYQCDIKGYQPGGTDWRLGKGKPPLDRSKDLWEEYLQLWRTWAEANPDLMAQLAAKAVEFDYLLSDMFATTPVNQARALAEILNENWSNP